MSKYVKLLYMSNFFTAETVPWFCHPAALTAGAKDPGIPVAKMAAGGGPGL